MDYYNRIFFRVKSFVEVGAGDHTRYFAWKMKETKRDVLFITVAKPRKYDGLEDFMIFENEEVVKRLPDKSIDGVFLHKATRELIDLWYPKARLFIGGCNIETPSVWKAVNETFEKFLVNNNIWHYEIISK